MRRTALSAAAVTLAAVVAAYAALSWRLAGELVAFPRASAAEVLARDGLRGPADVGLPPPADLQLPAGDATLSAWLFRHPRPAGCGVVLSHGHASTRHGVLRYAPLFWARGCDLLLLDLRHHGASGGEVFTWGDRERYDLVLAADALAAAAHIPRARVGLFGDSLGGAVSLEAAALAPDLAFVISDSSYADLPRIVALRGVARYGPGVLALVPGAFAAAAWRAGFDPWRASPAADAPAVRVPVLLVHARADRFTPAWNALELFRRLPPGHKELWLVDGAAEHSHELEADPVRYRTTVDAFLAAHAPGFGRPPALASHGRPQARNPGVKP